MKKCVVLVIIFSIQVSHARSDAAYFNRVLMDDVKTDVKKEATPFKVKGRSPASVETSDTDKIIDQENNLDKTDKNLNQLGHKKW